MGNDHGASFHFSTLYCRIQNELFLLYLPWLLISNHYYLHPSSDLLSASQCTIQCYVAFMALNEFVEGEQGLLDKLLNTVSPSELLEYRNEVHGVYYSTSGL